MSKVYKSLSLWENATEETLASAGRLANIESILADPKKFANFAATRGRSIGLKIPEEIMSSGEEAIKAWARNEAQVSLGRVRQAKIHKMYIDRAKNVLNQPDGAVQLRELLDVSRGGEAGGFFATKLEREIPSFRSMMDKIDEVYRLDGSRLSDSKFVLKGIELKKYDPEGFKLFLANPKNYSRWLKLESSPGYVSELIEKGSLRIPWKRKMIGITPAETAKRVGLGVGAPLTGAVAIYHWFGSNDPKEVSMKSSDNERSIQSIRTSGEGQEILNKAKASVSKINALAQSVDKDLSTGNASQSTYRYISGINAELLTLTQALEHWDVVVQNSDDPQFALSAGKKLLKYTEDLAKNNRELQRQLGISDSGVASKTTMKPVEKNNNILEIQKILQLNQTGILDKETVDNLQALERQFNRKANTEQFTGAFVNPQTGYVISPNNLATAYRKIQKY